MPSKSKKNVKIWSITGKVDRSKRAAKVTAAISEKNILPTGRTRARPDFNYNTGVSRKEEEGATVLKKLKPRAEARSSRNTSEMRAKPSGVRKVRKAKGTRDSEEKSSKKKRGGRKSSKKQEEKSE